MPFATSRSLALLLVGLLPALATAAPGPKALTARDVRSLEAGAELWVTLDHLEVQTFNEGVMEKPEDRVRRTHEPARQEKWQFGQRFEAFTFDGKHFRAAWTSPDFQAQTFTESLLTEGEVAPDGASATLVLTRVRFEPPSTEPPEQRGFSKIVLRFEDLLANPGLGGSVTYRFVAGKSRVAIDEARGDFVASEYHSQTTTTWKGLAPFTGKNEVTGQPRGIFASVTLETWGRRGPPPAVEPPARDKPLVVRVAGNSKLAAEVMAWLATRKGVSLLDHTARAAKATQQERDLARAGLLNEDASLSPEARPLDADLSLELTSLGTDPRDPSTRAVLRRGETEVEVLLDLQMARYQKLGDAALGEWARLQREGFLERLTKALEANGL